jgi:hypothetical protein
MILPAPGEPCPRHHGAGMHKAHRFPPGFMVMLKGELNRWKHVTSFQRVTGVGVTV